MVTKSKDPIVTRAVLLHIEMVRADNKARAVQVELGRLAANMSEEQFQAYTVECAKNGIGG